MQIIADTHCHTIASDHAYSTITENAIQAAEKGIKYLAITDHGISMPDAPHLWHFHNLRIVPRSICGVKILYGVESNILNYHGDLDMDNDTIDIFDWIVASYHEPVCAPSNVNDHSEGYINLAKNNTYVDVIGHSGNDSFKYDYKRVIKVFKEYDKIVEINEGSLSFRKGSKVNCIEIAKLCKKYEVKVVVNSDAHISYKIGCVENSFKMLKEISFPQRLVLNADEDKFVDYVKAKRGVDLNNL